VVVAEVNMLRTGSGLAALIIAGLATACSSSNNATGTGGAGGSGAAGNSGSPGAAGNGGATGAAGTSGGAGTGGSIGEPGAGGGIGPSDAGVADAFTGTPDAGARYTAMCASGVKNKGTCVTATDVQCANTCGPNKAGYKNCDCFTDVWSCPKCEYASGDYACYRLPDPIEACPVDPNDAGITLPTVGSACTRAACSPCGSATLSSYLDSGGSPKVGYCVCGDGQKWTCASTSEWPK
jgi:hypothetical protein